jgi:phosphoadenosine phosphosulfate reductase
MSAPSLPSGLEDIDRRLSASPAEEVIGWAADAFGDGLVLTASFTDCVLIDLVARTAPQVPVLFLDTQYHFVETLEYVEEVRSRYGLEIEVLRPLVEPDDRWRTDPDGCCHVRKIAPLGRALRGRRAWMSGLRRSESPTRAAAPVVSWDSRWQVVKVNPIVGWSDATVADYQRAHELPQHPLVAHGYRSIGCWPCTRPTTNGEHPRDGRWSGSDKRECGLHAAPG